MGKILKIEDVNPENRPAFTSTGKDNRNICFNYHKDLEIDVDAKIIRCKHCGYCMTAWEFVMCITGKADRTIDWINSLLERKKGLENSLEELGRQERNAKARLNRANNKLGK